MNYDGRRRIDSGRCAKLARAAICVNHIDLPEERFYTIDTKWPDWNNKFLAAITPLLIGPGSNSTLLGIGPSMWSSRLNEPARPFDTTPDASIGTRAPSPRPQNIYTHRHLAASWAWELALKHLLGSIRSLVVVGEQVPAKAENHSAHSSKVRCGFDVPAS